MTPVVLADGSDESINEWRGYKMNGDKVDRGKEL